MKRLMMMLLGLVCVFITFVNAENKTKSVDPLMVLDKLLRGYDRRSTPTSTQGVATNVYCEFYVASMGSINTDNMDYTTDLYLKQKWQDSRLSSDSLQEPLDLADPNLVKAIWKPEIFFPNAKEGDFQFVTMPNLLIRIHPDGQILYILRLRLKFSCMMELSRYPLDEQTCGMMISSFSKTTREMVLHWSKVEESVTVAKDLKMPQFTLEKVTAKQCDDYNHMGNYSCLVAKFHMKRSISFHLIQNYLPSMLMVVISWVSFWIDVETVPARVTLGGVTLLAISTQRQGTNVPQTSYVKAIDIWMGTCTAFVFAALVEFTFVNYTWRTKGKVNHRYPTVTSPCPVQTSKKTENGDKCVMIELEDPRHEDPVATALASANCWRKFATGIDEVSRMIFPLGFTVFNIIYWLYYLIIVQEEFQLDASGESESNSTVQSLNQGSYNSSYLDELLPLSP
ncbi:glycine receptor subunit alpha-3 isoform X2 [Eurytemora carolleeae]|uniref:glycine receptor subunit alpha-3 isoform X2 n=1 Tax=Eurytemora carolleeae TaxID=1294199 RepID=UPI000C78EACC|nr:glycine receptor subunit alpha-3 isoform X2 [Eurytemora carolleeae]|eukprot:XP_023325803.1 glycine receptor subunit alpha-3-like isoform X2 [Eurytemora affinis]